MPIYAFSCDCGWQGDIRTKFEQNNVLCPSCESVTHKESVYRISFGGFARTPSEERDWSGDFKNFREANAELDYKKERLEDATQTRIVEPPLGRMGAENARALERAGATVDDLS